MITQINVNDCQEKKELEKLFPKLIKYFGTSRKGLNAFTQIYIIKEADQPVGYIIIDIIYERMEIIEIEVLEEKRKKGYGSALIKFIIKKAEIENLENITLEVNENNEIAIYLYTKNDFKKVAVRKNYYQNADGILMERKMI